MVSPHAAGVTALTWAANKDLSNIKVRGILQDTAENLGLSENHQGYGLIRADIAVDAAAGVVTAGVSISPSREHFREKMFPMNLP